MSEKYILKGIFTKFDTMNGNNGRIYDGKLLKLFYRNQKLKKILKLI